MDSSETLEPAGKQMFNPFDQLKNLNLARECRAKAKSADFSCPHLSGR
jgi:hypothetical protein